MKLFRNFVLLAIAVIVTACGKSDRDPSTDPEYVEDKVFFASSLPPYIDAALKECLPNTTRQIAEANVAVVRSSDFSAYRDDLANIWKRGGIIIEIFPEHQLHKEFWDYAGPGAFLPSDLKPDDLLLLAVHNYGSFRVVNPLHVDNHLQDVEIEEDEKASPSDEVFTEEELPFIEIQASSDYVASKLSFFNDWMLRNLAKEGLQGSENSNTNAELADKISDLIHRDDCSQVVSGTLSIGVDNYPLCKIAASKPDKVSRHSEYEYSVTITPFYAFGVNGNSPADYYFVTVDFTSHNDKLYGVYKKKHGAVPTYAHAFYSENINWTAELQVGSDYKVSIPKGMEPSPATTVGQMKYTSGFSSALNITGQVGFVGKVPSGMLTVGGTFTWSNAVELTLDDQTISMSTSNGGSEVKYQYKGVNHMLIDNPDKAVPQILKSDQQCTASWCWKVDGVSDNDASTFKIVIKTDPLYGYMYRHCTWGAEGHSRHDVHMLPENDRTITIEVKSPNRVPSGVIAMKCNSRNHIRNVYLYDSKSAKIDSAMSSYEKGFILKFQKPVGTYKIQYDLYDPDGKTAADRFKGTYTISGISVNVGQTTEVQSDNVDQ